MKDGLRECDIFDSLKYAILKNINILQYNANMELLA